MHVLQDLYPRGCRHHHQPALALIGLRNGDGSSRYLLLFSNSSFSAAAFMSSIELALLVPVIFGLNFVTSPQPAHPAPSAWHCSYSSSARYASTRLLHCKRGHAQLHQSWDPHTQNIAKFRPVGHGQRRQDTGRANIGRRRISPSDGDQNKPEGARPMWPAVATSRSN